MRAAAVELQKPLIFLVPEEVSEALGVSLLELREMRKAGQGPKWTAITPRSVLYFASDVARMTGSSTGGARAE